MGVRQTTAARDQLRAQASRPGGPGDFADAVMRSVAQVVGHDGWCLLGLDPLTGARSSMFCRDGVGDPRRLAHNEWVEQDVHRYVDLARAPLPVGILRADGPAGDAASTRLQEILLPAGVTSELRVALRSGGRLWGALCLFRADHSRPFCDGDVEAVLDVLVPLTETVRRYPVRPCAPTVDLPDPGPGVIVLDADDEVVGCTPAARAWLSEAVAGGFDEDRPDRVHRAVYDVARLARGPDGTEALSRIRTARGFWLAVTASRLGTSDQVAVVVQRASPGQLVPAFAQWHRLTPRERDVLDALMAGHSAKQMARRLRLSPYTVNDHLAAIYRKVDVRGRDELTALLL